MIKSIVTAAAFSLVYLCMYPVLTGQFVIYVYPKWPPPLAVTYILIGMVIPVIVLLTKKGRRPLPMFIVGIMVVVGAWFKRYLIVTPTLLHPFLPMQDSPQRYKQYFPSWEEWAIAMGTLAGALLVITFFVRIFPIVPIHETITEQHEKAEVL